MGRKKNPENKTREEEIRANLEKEQQEYMAALKKSKSFDAPRSSSYVDSREAFRDFWALAKKNYKKTKDIEDILWAHIKAAGFDKPELFEKGIEHFGLKRV